MQMHGGISRPETAAATSVAFTSVFNKRNIGTANTNIFRNTMTSEFGKSLENSTGF